MSGLTGTVAARCISIGHGAQHALGLIPQTDELPQIRLASQIEHSTQGRMMVPLLPDLHEEDPSAEVVHDLLKPMHIPPLDCEVEFAASGDNSEWNLVLGDFLHLGIQEFSFFEMDVTFKIRRGDIHLQVFREKLVKPVGQR